MNNVRKFIRLVSQIFDGRDKFNLGVILVLQVGLATLDLFGVILFSAVIALTLSPDYFNSSSSSIRQVFDFLGISNLEQSEQLILIGTIAGVMLIVKSVVSYLVSAKITGYFSKRAALLSKKIFRNLMLGNLEYLRTKSTQHFIYATTDGVQSIMVRGVAGAIVLMSDLVMFSVYIIGIFIVNPIMALIVLLFFGSVSYLVNHRTLVRNIELSRKSTSENVSSKEIVEDALESYREVFVKGRRIYFVESFGEARAKVAELLATQSLISLMPKYVIDIALVVGSLLIGCFAFLTQPTPRAILLVSIFLLASARIVPALLRAQQGYSNIRSAIASTPATFELLNLVQRDDATDGYSSDSTSATFKLPADAIRDTFLAEITVRNVQFAFRDSNKELFTNLNLDIKSGEFCAIVGRSGVGKSTLMDLLLGLVKPQDGIITIGGFDPAIAISTWPWAIGYVPQSVSIVDGSIKKNVCLGFDENSVEDSIVEDLLKKCELPEFCSNEMGINSVIGTGGLALSGGQRQRIGLARALLTSPKLLILDEATSALDEKAEEAILNTLRVNYPGITVILVSHRSSAIRHFEKVFQLDSSKRRKSIDVAQKPI